MNKETALNILNNTVNLALKKGVFENINDARAVAIALDIVKSEFFPPTPPVPPAPSED